MPTDRKRDLATLRLIAKRARSTWTGRHWPSAKRLDYDGAGVWFIDSKSSNGPGPDALDDYLATFSPVVMLRLLDEMDTLRAALDLAVRHFVIHYDDREVGIRPDASRAIRAASGHSDD